MSKRRKDFIAVWYMGQREEGIATDTDIDSDTTMIKGTGYKYGFDLL